MRINLANTPAFSKTYSVSFPRLAGGLNLRDLGYLIDNDESPYMKNLMWRNGLLQSRPGRKLVAQLQQTGGSTSAGGATLPGFSFNTAFSCYEGLFHGYAFFHINDSIWCLNMTGLDEDVTTVYTPLPCVESGQTVPVPESRGTFFRYQDYLFYKNSGGFFRIEYSATPGLDLPFACRDVVHIAEEVGNAPIIVINASPLNGSGTIYQPENRISALKTVWYTAQEGVVDYHLPAQYIDGVVLVKVDGVTLTAGSQYSVNNTQGVVHFNQAPNPGKPIANNTVQITYAKANPDAMRSVLQCKYAAVAGGDTNLCILLGGCDAQPNAVFWNSNDELAMQHYYFPITCYNLVGDTEDPVTGFGRQYNDTLVFKEHSTGKLAYNIESIDGRNSISFGYVGINAKIGCDLPWTIQLVENNVVFCNTYQGAHVVLSSSAAFENNIQCLSEKINSNESSSGADIGGLLSDIADSLSPVVGFDDGERYWLCTAQSVYVWDYSVSTYAKPSWFYWTDIDAIAFLLDDHKRAYSLTRSGGLCLFGPYLSDSGKGIEKVYQFPTLHFGTYERLKNVESILLTFRGDTAATVSVQYDTDYETRADTTPVVVWPGNDVQARRYVTVAKRKPACRHVRQFGLTLRNSTAGEDLALVSAQVFYRFTGEER